MSIKVTFSKIVFSVICLGFFLFLKWLLLPAANLSYSFGFLFYGISLVVFIANITLYSNKIDYLDEFGSVLITILLGSFLVFIIWFIIGIIGSNFFNKDTSRNQLGTVIEKNYIDEIEPIDLTQIPYVDPELARKLGDKKLGEDPTLGSQVTLGDFTMQQVNGKLVLVAPLVHNANKSGTTGYIVVSATNPEDVHIKEINKNKYQINAFFNEDLKRHVRNSGFTSEILADYSFELDDNGYPYWIIKTCKNQALFENPEATGTIVVDAMTGECKKFNIDNTPTWIDIIQPEFFIADQIDSYDISVHRWFDSMFEGHFFKPKTINKFFNNGNCYYYTGLTPYDSDESTIGFLLIDSRTKDCVKLSLSGINENTAITTAEDKLEDLSYKASYPLIVNIDGIPTYFMTLKNDKGIIKKFAFVNISDSKIIGVGDSIIQAKGNYSYEYLN